MKPRLKWKWSTLKRHRNLWANSKLKKLNLFANHKTRKSESHLKLEKCQVLNTLSREIANRQDRENARKSIKVRRKQRNLLRISKLTKLTLLPSYLRSYTLLIRLRMDSKETSYQNSTQVSLKYKLRLMNKMNQSSSHQSTEMAFLSCSGRSRVSYQRARSKNTRTGKQSELNDLWNTNRCFWMRLLTWKRKRLRRQLMWMIVKKKAIKRILN